MTIEEFKKSINLRDIERCCATCEHGWVDADGECRCYHPSVANVSEKINKVFNFGDGWHMETKYNSVCDEWEAEKSC